MWNSAGAALVEASGFLYHLIEWLAVQWCNDVQVCFRWLISAAVVVVGDAYYVGVVAC